MNAYDLAGLLAVVGLGMQGVGVYYVLGVGPALIATGAQITIAGGYLLRLATKH